METNKQKEHIDLIIGWNEIDSETKFILGRPNFSCGQMASRLREIGFQCDKNAEMEQALVIHLMLEFKNKYSDAWRVKFMSYLKHGADEE